MEGRDEGRLENWVHGRGCKNDGHLHSVLYGDGSPKIGGGWARSRRQRIERDLPNDGNEEENVKEKNEILKDD